MMDKATYEALLKLVKIGVPKNEAIKMLGAA